MEVISGDCEKNVDNVKSEDNNDNLEKCNCRKTALDISDLCLAKNNPNTSINKSDYELATKYSSPLSTAKSNCHRSSIQHRESVQDGLPHNIISCHNNITQPLTVECKNNPSLRFNSGMHFHNDVPSACKNGKIVNNESPKETSMNTSDLHISDVSKGEKYATCSQNLRAKGNCSDEYQLESITTKSKNCLIYKPIDPWTKINSNINQFNTNEKSDVSTMNPWVLNTAASNDQHSVFHNSLPDLEIEKGNQIIRNDDNIEHVGKCKTQLNPGSSSSNLTIQKKIIAKFPNGGKHIKHLETIEKSNEEIVNNYYTNNVIESNVSHNITEEYVTENLFFNMGSKASSNCLIHVNDEKLRFQESNSSCGNVSKTNSLGACSSTENKSIEIKDSIEPLQETRC